MYGSIYAIPRSTQTFEREQKKTYRWKRDHHTQKEGGRSKQASLVEVLMERMSELERQGVSKKAAQSEGEEADKSIPKLFSIFFSSPSHILLYQQLTSNFSLASFPILIITYIFI